MRWHPDRNAGDDSAFKKLTAAKAVLEKEVVL
jgi:DnaJ-class molecular chaperone